MGAAITRGASSCSPQLRLRGSPRSTRRAHVTAAPASRLHTHSRAACRLISNRRTHSRRLDRTYVFTPQEPEGIHHPVSLPVSCLAAARSTHDAGESKMATVTDIIVTADHPRHRA